MTFYAAILLSLTAPGIQAVPVRLVVNGRPCQTSDARPFAVLSADNTTLLSFERLREATGAECRLPRSVVWFGRELRFTPGSTRYWGSEDGERKAAVAPYVAGDTWLPAEMIEAAFGWKVKCGEGEVLLWGPGAAVLQVRQGDHPDRCRVVLDLSQPCLYQVTSDGHSVSLLIPPASATGGSAGDLQVFEFGSSIVPRVILEVAQDGWTQVTIPFTKSRGLSILMLSEPARLVVDVLLPSQQPATSQLPVPPPPTAQSPVPPASSATAPPKPAPVAATPPKPARAPVPSETEGKPELSGGETLWRTMQWPTGAGEAVVHVVVVDPKSNGLEIRPALGGPLVRSLCSVLTIAKVHEAVAAVNGGFFSPRERVPLGMLVIDGEWMRAPLTNRPVFAVMQDGSCDISRVAFEAGVHFEELGFLPLLGINQNHWENNSVVVFTERWGPSAPAASGTTRLVVSACKRVVHRDTSGKELAIPAGGMVISGNGRRAETLQKVPLGRQVTLSYATRPSWPKLKHALGGGPLLLAGGKIVLNAAAEGFRSDVANGRRPRTAVGIRADGRIVIATVEGPPLGRGSGMTLAELARFMQKLEAQAAMNLDGGSSTTLIVENKVITKCSSGSPRLVNNALVVAPPRSSSAAD